MPGRAWDWQPRGSWRSATSVPWSPRAITTAPSRERGRRYDYDAAVHRAVAASPRRFAASFKSIANKQPPPAVMDRVAALRRTATDSLDPQTYHSPRDHIVDPARTSHFFRSSTPQLALFADRAVAPSIERERGPGMYSLPLPPWTRSERRQASAFASVARGAGRTVTYTSAATHLDALATPRPLLEPSGSGNERGVWRSAPSSRGHTWGRTSRDAAPVGAINGPALYTPRASSPRDAGAGRLAYAAAHGTIGWELTTGLHFSPHARHAAQVGVDTDLTENRQHERRKALL